jgi:hypothetical protein
MSGVPKAVGDAIAFWRAGHRQTAIRWSRQTWVSWLPQHEELLRDLGNPLGREDVTAPFAALDVESCAAEAAERAFVAAMVWGYGPVGYGAWRTHRILDINDDPGTRLLAIHEDTRKGGPAGFRAMASARLRLRHLGVAFGTKFLFFSAEASQPDVRAPVLDRVVRTWLAENTELKLDIWSWRPRHYELYCTKLADWGEALEITAGEVEEAIFEYATRGPVERRAPSAGPTELVEELSRLVEGARRDDDEKAAANEALDALSDFFVED